MDDKSVADYFVVAGLDWSKQPLLPQDEVFPIEAKTSAGQHQDPMVELAVINRTMGESNPEGFKCIEFTPTGFPADLNHGSIRAPEMFLCYRRGRDMPPIVDVGILYEGKDTKERLLPGCEVIYLTPYGRSANVNNSSGTKIFVTFRRASPIAPCDVLVVTEMCIILYNKGEFAPHAHCIIRKNLNRGMMGSEVYLCYKKSMVKVNCLAYKPSILSRYPVEDLPNLPLPQQVSTFCLPMGATLESWPPENLPPTPVFSTFILTTGIAAEKVYGAAVVFQEPLPPEKVALLDEDQRRVLGVSEDSGYEGNEEEVGLPKGGPVVHQNKSICLLSRSPFFDTFKKFLFYIYRLVFSKVDLYSQQIPLERHVAHFLSKIPMPCIQRPRIMIQLSPLTSIILTQPDETPLPKSGASFVDVLKNLGPTNCVLLLLSCLMEHKILVHSLRPAVLTGVAEAIAAMIFPLHWQCPYIPLCPLSLSYVLHSPTPFIVGIDSRYFDTFELPTEVTCVDLDTNTLTISEDRRSHTIKMLPKKPSKLLKSSLERLYGCLSECPEILTPTLPREGAQTLDDQYFNAELAVNKKRMQLELLIREAYLRFMASILKGYNNFLLPITNAPTDGAMDLNSLFDILGFVKSRDKAYHKFYALLMKTQSFSRFIEERSFVSDKDSSLAFFDYCLDKVDEGQEGQRLIEIDETQLSSERTVLIMGPEPDDPDHPPISYPGYFPDLDPLKFNERSRPSPPTPTSRPSQIEPHPLDQGQMLHLGSKISGYNSPMVCRTQHEIKQSQKIAVKHANVPGMWARFLAWHCYSLWFIHLSSYAKNVHSKSKVLRSSYDVLVTMQSSKLQPPDEVCYRVLMQLCGIYQLPVLAVKVLFEMKRRGIQPNAITYGFYNKAVLESKWPTSHATADQLWTKLRNVVMAVAYFKRGSSFCTAPHHVPAGGVGLRYGLGIGPTHPQIPHSNSESDPDRQSMDSYLDSVSVEASSISAAVVPGTQSSNLASDVTGLDGRADPSAEEGKRSSGSRSPRKFFVPESNQKQFLDDPRNNSNSRPEDSAGRNSPGKSKLDGPANQPSGSRQRARSTSEMGGDIDLIGIIKHKSKESISAGGLSDRGYGSLSMEETRDGAMFSSHSLSATKGKEIHKSAEVTPTRTLSNEAGTSKDTESIKSPEKGSFQSSPSVSLDWQTNPHLASTVSSVRIPVTENDPLGLFNPPAPLQVASTTDVIPEKEKSHDEGARMTKSAQLLLFTSPSFSQYCSDEQATPVVPKTTESPCRASGEVVQAFPVTCGSAGRQSKTSKWVAMAAENVVGGGSELLGSALKMVTNRISRYRDAVSGGGARSGTPSSAAGPRTESTSSLNSAESSSDCSNGGCPTSSALLDKRHSEVIQVHDSESGFDVCLPTHPKRSSVTFQETPNKGTSSSKMRSAPFVSNFWNGLRNLQQSDTFKGFTSGLSQVGTSVKATVKETLTSDVWGLHNAMPFGALPNVGADFYGGSISGSIDEENEEDAGDGKEAKDDNGDDDDDLTLKRLPLPQLNDPSCPYASTVGADLGQMCPGTFGNPSRDSTADPRHGQYDPGSLSSIPSNVSGTAPPNPRLHPVQVEMSTLNKCSKCLNLIYDEEIMAGWTADDSNLNTSCQFCTSQLVPFINIYIKDYRPFLETRLVSNLSQSSESILSCQSSTANPARSDRRQRATAGDFESTPISNAFASHGRRSGDETLPEEETDVKLNGPSVGRGAQVETISDESKDVAENVPSFPATSAPSPAVDSLRRRKSISSLPEVNEEERASKKDRKNKSGSVDALNDSRNDLNSDVDPVEPASRSENEASPAENFVELEPQCYPYLSPLVLRKEVENLLVQEGDSCFDGDALVDEHPILFWNLVWYFKRLDIPSHLPSFVATCKSLNQHLERHVPTGHQQFSGSRSKQSVAIRAVWDNVRLHTDHGPPMYILWNQGLSKANDMFSKRMMITMVECVMRNDVSKPLRLILSERARHLIALQTTEPSATTPRQTYTSFHSIYRDILFLSFVALGRDNIDVDAFDKEFKNVLADLAPYDSARLRIADRAPRAAAVSCRKVFKDLEI